MRFALLGDDPDGVAMARALTATGRHECVALQARPATGEALRTLWPAARFVGDAEEILADPAVEAVIVAGPIADRPALLRRALQSERHALCVYPPDRSPDVGYEAALIRGDTGRVLFPLLPLARHPAVARLAEVVGGQAAELRLLQLERRSPHVSYADADEPVTKPALPDWALLRAVGGEIAEVSAFSRSEDFTPAAPFLLSGRFERGGLFQATLIPGESELRWRLNVVGDRHAELVLEKGPSGPADLRWEDEAGTKREEHWQAGDPWAQLVAAFEAEVGAGHDARRGGGQWQDAVHALELDDAARRSLERRRASTLEYPEASEEVGFKGTMTLVGCATLWGILFLLILANWFRPAKWAIIPVLVIFLGLQLLRWLIPGPRAETHS